MAAGKRKTGTESRKCVFSFPAGNMDEVSSLRNGRREKDGLWLGTFREDGDVNTIGRILIIEIVFIDDIFVRRASCRGIPSSCAPYHSRTSGFEQLFHDFYKDFSLKCFLLNFLSFFCECSDTVLS
jgi:hypothetical protein